MIQTQSHNPAPRREHIMASCVDLLVMWIAAMASTCATTTNARLEVNFFWPFWGDYLFIDLSENYDYAVVGHPVRDYLWILSLTPDMEAPIYRGIFGRLQTKGYRFDRLQKTLQPTHTSTSDPSGG